VSLRQGLGLRVEPPRLVPDDPDPELLGAGGDERTAGGGDDGRGEDVRAGAVLLVLRFVPLDVEVEEDFDFLPSSLTEGDFPDVLLEPELPETEPRSR